MTSRRLNAEKMLTGSIGWLAFTFSLCLQRLNEDNLTFRKNILTHAEPGRQQLTNTALKSSLWSLSQLSVWLRMLCVAFAVVMAVLASTFASMRINGLHHCSPAPPCSSDLHYPCMLARTHPLMLISLSLSFQSFRGLIVFLLFLFWCCFDQTEALLPRLLF